MLQSIGIFYSGRLSPLCMYESAYSVYLQLIFVVMCVLSTADLATHISRKENIYSLNVYENKDQIKLMK